MDSRARFEALYRAHCGAVRAFVHRRVRPAVADDVVADVFVREASIVRDRYFAIALHPVGNDYGDDVHLEAFNAAGRRIATQGHPLPGTPH